MSGHFVELPAASCWSLAWRDLRLPGFQQRRITSLGSQSDGAVFLGPPICEVEGGEKGSEIHLVSPVVGMRKQAVGRNQLVVDPMSKIIPGGNAGSEKSTVSGSRPSSRIRVMS